MVIISRRAATSGLLVTPFMYLPYSARAQEQGCSALAALRERVLQEQINAAIWGATTAPLMEAKITAQLAELEANLAAAEAAADQKSKERTLQLLNTGGALVFAVLGTGLLGAISAPSLILGSIAFTGTMMLAGALSAVQPASACEFVGEFGADRAGVILEAMGDEAYALSGRSASISNLAGNALGWGSFAYNLWKWKNVDDTYDDLIAHKVEADNKLAEFRASLSELSDVNTATMLREQSMQLLIEDIDAAMPLGCPGLP